MENETGRSFPKGLTPLVDDEGVLPDPLENSTDVTRLSAIDGKARRPNHDLGLERPELGGDGSIKLSIKVDLTGENGEYKQFTNTHGKTLRIWE